MKKLMLSLAAAAIACFSGSSAAEAQVYQSGYQFGTGLQFGGFPFGNTFSRPREGLPYFAQYPPVYYSHIVRRPYGISPFAAPPGIVPVEMTISAVVAEPAVIKNPHFHTPIPMPPANVPVQPQATEPLPKIMAPGDASEDTSAESKSNPQSNSDSSSASAESENKSTQHALPLRIKNPFAAQRLTLTVVK